ncbi:hypothetical protein PCANC_22420, partial [Puccinia coronata f. sp. avenae]
MSSGTCLRVPGTRLRVPVGFQQVPANGCRVRVRVSGFGVKKQAGTRRRYPPNTHPTKTLAGRAPASRGRVFRALLLTKVASWQAGKNIPAFQEPESCSPGELVQYQLAGSSPGKHVQYQLAGSSPGELVQYQLAGSSPGKLVQYQLAGSSPGKLVQYQLVRRASWRAGTIPAGWDSQAPNKLALYQLAGRDPAMVLNLHWHTRGYLPQVPGYPSEMAAAGAGVSNAWF